jgi:hypothetical protein
VNVFESRGRLRQKLIVQLLKIRQLLQKEGSDCCPEVFRKACKAFVAAFRRFIDQLPELSDAVLGEELSELIVFDVLADEGSPPCDHADGHLCQGESGIPFVVQRVGPSDDETVVVGLEEDVLETEVAVDGCCLLGDKEDSLAHLSEVEATHPF